MDRNRYQSEAARLAALLRKEIARRGVSVRSLEQSMGVGTSIYAKVLTGKITMSLSHLLQILDALEMDWPEFFHLAYGLPAEEPPSEEHDFDHRVLDVLRRHGLLPPGD